MNGEDLVFKLKADFIKALAHPLRLAIIEHLKTGERSVGQLALYLEVNQSHISKNLSVLKQAGILKSHQEKSTVYYAIKDDDIFKVLRGIADILGKKLRESERLLEHLAK